jgi:hypothetical protein
MFTWADSFAVLFFFTCKITAYDFLVIIETGPASQGLFPYDQEDPVYRLPSSYRLLYQADDALRYKY